jgi:iron-sulfur cluster assembly protein
MALTITESGAKRVQEFGGTVFRIGVKPSGCTGYSYYVNVIRREDIDLNQDTVFESNGIALVTDQLSLPIVDGTNIDFNPDPFNGGWVFDNPNKKDSCGCGESFNT